MGHQYRLSMSFTSNDEVGMRRIFPIVLIRGIRVPQLETLFNHQEARSEAREHEDEPRQTSVSPGPSQPRRSSSRTVNPRRTRRTKRLPTQPLRRSPRLNKGKLAKK